MSVKISAAFPSNYVKASDLNGQPWDMKIRAVAMEDLGQGSDKESKPVVYFDGAQKGVPSNSSVLWAISRFTRAKSPGEISASVSR